ncbi:hypothetical protein HB665_15355 [Bacillus paranthracis]|uniref:hypothetical protein n=1 Tax=Bacillus cereus group TaxID=86661 RepID=UPI0014440A03|nr:hypothetical protein [Bacillus paranthracis]NKX25543.1 hypothetical protein [Bacillus paranthracis]
MNDNEFVNKFMTIGIFRVFNVTVSVISIIAMFLFFMVQPLNAIYSVLLGFSLMVLFRTRHISDTKMNTNDKKRYFHLMMIEILIIGITPVVAIYFV